MQVVMEIHLITKLSLKHFNRSITQLKNERQDHRIFTATKTKIRMNDNKKTKTKPLPNIVESAADRMLMRLPVCVDWVKYKGNDVVVQWNFEATKKAKKPMVDVSYCMTKALNQVILKTVQWDKRRFKPSRLGNAKW